MDAWGSGGEQLARLLEALGDAEILRPGGVVAGGLQVPFQPVRDGRAAHGGDADDLLGRNDGQQAGNDGNGDCETARGRDKIEVGLVVVKKLGDHAVGAGVNLLFQIEQVLLQGGGLHVLLRIARDGDAKWADAKACFSVADVGDKLVGVGKAIDWGDEGGLAFWGVAAEGDDVADARGMDLEEDLVEVAAGGADAGEMAGCGNVKLGLHPGGDVECSVPGAAKGAVGDGHVVRGQGGKFGENLVEIRHGGLVLRGKDLE